MGVQPTGSDFTPGDFTIRLLNDTGIAIDGINVDASGYFFDDQDRSTRWTFAISPDDVTYVPFFSIQSDEVADAMPEWQLQAIAGSVPLPESIADGAQFFLQIQGSDAGGSGSRDEFALANLSVTATSSIAEPGSVLLPTFMLAGATCVTRRRSS